MSVPDIIGFVGVSILLVAFLLTLIHKIFPNGMVYIILNIVGSALACISAIMIMYVPFIILEGVWAIVSIVTLAGLLRKPESERGKSF